MAWTIEVTKAARKQLDAVDATNRARIIAFLETRVQTAPDPRQLAVRLIGDDQQLAAIGAGGVLRDIRATHGAVQLNELVRFADPAEGAASLALAFPDGRFLPLCCPARSGRIAAGVAGMLRTVSRQRHRAACCRRDQRYPRWHAEGNTCSVAPAARRASRACA